LHRTRYGYALQADAEIVNLRVKVVHHGPQVTFPEIAAELDSHGEKSTESYGENELFRVLARNEISVNQKIQGPVIIMEYSSTTFVEAGWAACSDVHGNLLLSKLN
jgi:N-methylhydantoinase A